MALRKNNFDHGTDGTTITIANSANTGAGNDGFPYVDITGAGTTLTYDNDHARSGTLAAKVSPVSGGRGYLQFGGSTGNLASNDIAIDVWFYFTTNPSEEFTLISAYRTDGTRRLNVNRQTDGKLKIRDEGSTYLHTTASAVPNTGWVRARIYSRNQGAGGSFLAMDVLDASAAVLDAWSTTTATRTEPIAAVAVGKTGTNTMASAFWVDDFQVETAATGYIGNEMTLIAEVTTSAIIDANTLSTNVLDYAITHVSGPSAIGDATELSPGIWSVPVPDLGEGSDVWRITGTGAGGETGTADVTVVESGGQGSPVVMLYCTAPGVFV